MPSSARKKQTAKAHRALLSESVSSFRQAQNLRAARRLQVCFFFNDTATTEIYTLSLHDALPIWASRPLQRRSSQTRRLRPSPARFASLFMEDREIHVKAAYLRLSIAALLLLMPLVAAPRSLAQSENADSASIRKTIDDFLAAFN